MAHHATRRLHVVATLIALSCRSRAVPRDAGVSDVGVSDATEIEARCDAAADVAAHRPRSFAMHLAPVWQSYDRSANDLAATPAGESVVILRSEETRLLDAATGTLRAAAVTHDRYEAVHWPRVHPLGQTIVLGEGGAVSAIDPTTMRTRWKAQVAIPPTGVLDQAVDAGAFVVARFTARQWLPEERWGVVAVFDAATGEVRWQERFAARVHTVAAIEGHLVVETEGEPERGPGWLYGRDLASGHPRWRQSQPRAVASDVMAPSPSGLVLGGEWYGLMLIDPATGHVLRRYSERGRLRGRGHPFAIDGTTAYAPVTFAAGMGRGGPPLDLVEVVAIDLETGRARWRSEPTYTGFGRDEMPPLIVDRDVIYACAADGSLRAYDRATGATRGTWGVGDCYALAPLRNGPDEPLDLLIASRRGITRFGRYEAASLLRSVQVTGTVRLRDQPFTGATVLVAGHPARTDARGVYSLTVETALEVEVKVPRHYVRQQAGPTLSGVDYGESSAAPCWADMTQAPVHERDGLCELDLSLHCDPM